MLKIKNLLVKRGDFKLEIDDFYLEKGQICLLIGPNGSGKTTLMKAISRIVDYYGDVSVNEVLLNNLSSKELSKNIFYMEQNQNNADLRVEDILITGRFPYTDFLSRYTKKDYLTVESIMNKLDLYKHKDRFFDTLSEGEKQKIIFGKTFVQNSKVLLLDEPTSSLDIKNKKEVKSFILSYIKENKESSVILSTHDMDYFIDIADKVLILKEGSVFYTGDKNNLRDKINDLF